MEKDSEYLTEKTTPLLLRIARSFSNYAITFFEILFVLFLASFAIGVAIVERGLHWCLKNSLELFVKLVYNKSVR